MSCFSLVLAWTHGPCVLLGSWQCPGHMGCVFYWAAGSGLGTWAVCSSGGLAVAWAHGPCVLVGGWQVL